MKPFYHDDIYAETRRELEKAGMSDEGRKKFPSGELYRDYTQPEAVSDFPMARKPGASFPVPQRQAEAAQRMQPPAVQSTQKLFDYFKNKRYAPTGYPQQDVKNHGGLASYAIEQMNAMAQKHGGGEEPFRQQLFGHYKQGLNEHYGEDTGNQLWSKLYEPLAQIPWSSKQGVSTNVMKKSLQKALNILRLTMANEGIMEEMKWFL